MTGFIAKHSGDRAQIVRVAGGNTVTLKPGDALPVEPFPALDENLIAHYLARGVTFVPEANEESKPVKKTAAEKAGKKTAAENAAEKAATEEAARLAAEKAAQIASAEKALDEAKALLTASGDDMVAKGEAEQMVASAEAALAALQA